MGLLTLVFALYLFLSEMKTYASKTRVGRQLSGAANYAKKRIRRIGTSEIGTEEAKDDTAAAALYVSCALLWVGPPSPPRSH